MRVLLPVVLATGLVAPILMASGAWAQQAGTTGSNAAPPQALTAPAGPVDPNRHIEAVGQGAQDPARAEVLEGRSRDMRKCMTTLTERRESEQEAREVCNKILSGLGE